MLPKINHQSSQRPWWRAVSCALGWHYFGHPTTQTVTGLAGGFSMTTLHREVKVCQQCDHQSVTAFDIATTAHLDESLDWQPKIQTNATTS